MGLLIEGKWIKQPIKAENGKFIRASTSFRNWISKDGSTGFKAQPGRYHLYISSACPWAHRVQILRKLKGLQDAISITIVDYFMGQNGWIFSQSSPDPLGFQFLHQVYTAADPTYTGRVSVPVLWDKQTHTIVSNQSSELIIMLNQEFECGNNDDFYPQELRQEITLVNQRVYESVNNGVYKSGFAGTQEQYQEAVHALFEGLDYLEERLSRQRFLCGNQITLADVRLFTTLVRFDPVYVGHFKCNIKKIEDYPNLRNYLRDIFQYGGIHETVDFEHIKKHYYMSHETINPTRIVPAGPVFDYMTTHDRERFE